MSDYPEHDKMEAVLDDAGIIGAFLEWLASEGYDIGRFSEEDEKWFPVIKSINTWLSEYFGIDQKKVSDEKELMLQALRKVNAE